MNEDGVIRGGRAISFNSINFTGQGRGEVIVVRVVVEDESIDVLGVLDSEVVGESGGAEKDLT